MGNEDQDFGVKIVRNALEAPLRTIAYNSGAEPAVVVQKVREGQASFGYNAATDK